MRLLIRWLACVVGLIGLAVLAAWLMTPTPQHEVPAVDQEELQRVRALHRQPIDPSDPLRLQQPVDYATGPAADWWPKGESPACAELVADGVLPPVAERVGSEPCVVAGVDGVGQHGGTLVLSHGQAEPPHRFCAATLLRWSPHGYPLVPHVAKSFQVSEDSRSFTFTLRAGMRWSDGDEFGTEDVEYWWRHEVQNATITPKPPELLLQEGKLPTFTFDHAARSFTITFPKPNALFLARCARNPGEVIVGSPVHYLSRYHPEHGDQELIAAEMDQRQIGTPLALYRQVKLRSNPAHPRLWPWVTRAYQANPPYVFVRNPYYFQVDTAGNQLPYIDRLFSEDIRRDMEATQASRGRLDYSTFKVKDYTLLMANRDFGGYECYRWFRADRSDAMVSVNINRRVEPGDPAGAQRAALLQDVRFRRALSLAVDRERIILANYHGETEPAQVAPGPESPFYSPELMHAAIAHDPAAANALLDEIGLPWDGDRRTYADGQPLDLIIDYPMWFFPSTVQFLVEDWAAVGIDVHPRQRASKLFYASKGTLEQDLTCFTGNNEFYPVLDPRCFVPTGHESNWAIGYARWYLNGGLYGDPRAEQPGCIEPPIIDGEPHPARRAMAIYDEINTSPAIADQIAGMQEIFAIAAENLWTISVCTSPDYVVVVKDGLQNVPKRVIYTFDFIAPANAAPETWYWSELVDEPGVAEQLRDQLTRVSEAPATAGGQVQAGDDGGSWAVLGSFIAWLFWIALALGILVLALRHPFVARRLLVMIPTMAVISVVVFLVIELPPGNYLDTRIAELQAQGEEPNWNEIDNLRKQYHLDVAAPVRYVRWMGLSWFWHAFDDDADRYRGLLQGHLGRAMSQDNKPVNDIVGDRILLTVLISLGTIIFTWTIAIPSGIYAAVRQYSLGDYAVTLIGFIGMCVPSFLLAIILMYVAKAWFGADVGGLFSPEYATQPDWSMGKVIDLMKHIWLPVLVLGMTGTGAMVRIMRGNLLDELHKPYVTTARAKGVRPLKLLMKYPVRLALNPFVSGIGTIFPQLVSGGAIVAMVLSLPTVGPLQLQAILDEDTYLAGSMLMILSLLGVIGTLVSDLLLLWLDPRIRMDGGPK